MKKSGRIINMIFHGPPGIGKSTAAGILFTPHQENHQWRSLATGLTSTNSLVLLEHFASSQGVFPGKKICFIDDADTMPRAAQLTIRRLIDLYPHTTFLLTANDIDKFDEPLQSRFLLMSFELIGADRRRALEMWKNRLKEKLTALGVPWVDGRLEEIVADYSHDLRTMINQIELEFGPAIVDA